MTSVIFGIYWNFMKSEPRAILEEARDSFIGQWGAMGTAWGISRTMAQVHALLLSSREPLTTDAIMEELKISRGNANTTLRELVGWGLVRSQFYKGDRKEYFTAESDIWKMFCIIARERKRREIEPALQVLRRCNAMTAGLEGEEAEYFHEMMSGLEAFIAKADGVLEKVAGTEDQGKLFNKLMTLI